MGHHGDYPTAWNAKNTEEIFLQPQMEPNLWPKLGWLIATDGHRFFLALEKTLTRITQIGTD